MYVLENSDFGLVIRSFSVIQADNPKFYLTIRHFGRSSGSIKGFTGVQHARR